MFERRILEDRTKRIYTFEILGFSAKKKMHDI